MTQLSGMWTAANVGFATRLWSEGSSASNIAMQLGGGCSRSQVIGKMARLGIKTPTRQGARIKYDAHEAQKKRDVHNERRRQKRLERGAIPRSLPSQRRDVLNKKPVFNAIPLPAVKDAWLPLPDTVPVLFADIKHAQCRWPLRDPCDDDFAMCGNKSDGNHAYCPTHHQLSIRPQA